MLEVESLDPAARSSAELDAAWAQALDGRAPESIFHTRLSYELWRRYFSSGQRSLVLMVKQASRVRAVLGLAAYQEEIVGLRARVLGTPWNWHLPNQELVGGGGQTEAWRALLLHLREARDFDLLEIGHLPAEGVGARELIRCAESLDFAWRWDSVVRAPYIDLQQSDWPTFRAGLGKKTRESLGSVERKLGRLGRVELDEYGGGPDIEARIDEFLRVEPSGWKLEQGSAIISSPELTRFYRAWITEAAERGWLRLFTLRLDGRPVSVELAFQTDGRVSSTKIGYEPELAKLSPGQVRQARVLERLFAERRATTYDFMGDSASPSAHKLGWASTSRELGIMRLCHPASLLGRAIFGALELRDAVKDTRIAPWIKHIQERIA